MKKTSHFPRQLNEDFETLFKGTRHFFGQKFNGKMLKTLTKANFIENYLTIISMFAIRLLGNKRIALRTVRCID